MSRRATELFLLCVAAPIVVLLFSMLLITQGVMPSPETLIVPLAMFVAFILAHLAARKLAPNADPGLLPLAFLLTGIGIAFITRIDLGRLASGVTTVATDLATKQILWLFVALAAFVIVLLLVRSIDKLTEYKYVLAIIGFLLLLIPMILGREVSGSKIWIFIGPFSFQPGEIAKIAIVLFMARYLVDKQDELSQFTWNIGPLRLPNISALLPLLFMWAIAFVIVVFEKDLGSALVFFFAFVTMLYFASGRKFYLVVSLILAAAAAVVLYLFFSHVQIRVQTWLNPFEDPQGTGYQLTQALFSIADGGFFGTGINQGMITTIPVVESDFIFAGICEEMGLLGAAGVLLLYLALCIRGFATAARAKTNVSSLVAAGLTTTVVLQSFIIVGGVTRLIPLTGLTLPLVSQGGSSLIMTFICLALLMRCGDEGTGLDTEITSTLHMTNPNNPMSRFALGKHLTSGMIGFALLFAVLVGNLTMLMVVQADDIKNYPGNSHTLAHQEKIKRGSISTADGVLLAQSVLQDDGTFEREYPQHTMAAHVVGYYSSRYGTSGIESSYNDVLTGQKSFATWSDAFDALTGRGTDGNDVTLSLNSRIQQATEQALEGYAGACIAINPKTGAILGMASSPTYDLSNIEKALTSTNNDSGSLYNRATQALYAPGSTFKIVTLAGALDNNVASPDTLYDSPGVMTIGNAEVSNFDHINYGTISLARATELSSNTAFAQLGVELGAKALVAAASKFGFDADIPFDLPLISSLMPEPSEMTEWETAWAAAGEPVGTQSPTHKSAAGPQATVLEMALVGCAIANGGIINQPYLIDSIYNASGELSYAARPNALFNACSPATAEEVRDVLEGVVNNGTGAEAQIEGVQVAGKTGTAELNDGNNYWFVGMAPSDDANIVVAIVIEKGEAGIATGRARNVIQTALEVQGIK